MGPKETADAGGVGVLSLSDSSLLFPADGSYH